MDCRVDQALINMHFAIQQSRKSNPVFLANSLSGRAAVSNNIANLMEAMSKAYATAMVEIAAECTNLTGNGDLSEAETFHELTREDASEHLITAIRLQAQEMEADIPSHDANAEHRLTAHDYGLEAAQ